MKKARRPWSPEARERHREGCRSYQALKQEIKRLSLLQDAVQVCQKCGYDMKTMFRAFIDDRLPKLSQPPTAAEICSIKQHIRLIHHEHGIAIQHQ